jgi:hypothetical protein
MKNTDDSKETRNKILAGLELSYKKLIESKRKTNSYIVIMKDNKIVKIKP